MRLETLCAAIAATFFALPALAQSQGSQPPHGAEHSGATTHPSTNSGQGSSVSGNAERELPAPASSGSNAMQAGRAASGFSQMDTNNDGQISRAEWEAASGSAAGGASAGAAKSGRPEPSSHAPSR